MPITKPQLVFAASFLLLVGAIASFGFRPIIGDEIWAATSVNGNPLDVIVFTLRWDLHPPIYYSALDVWALFGTSDFWLRLSSAFTHAAVVMIAFKFALKRENLTAAVIVALIVFSLPLLLTYSASLRMYALISLLSLGIYCLTEAHITATDESRLKWVLCLGVLLANAHATGILFVFFHFCYGCFGLFPDRRRLFRWAVLNFSIAVLALPAIGNSMIRSADHAAQPSFVEIFGLVPLLFSSIPGLNVVITLAALALLFAHKPNRMIGVCYLLLPLLVFAAISYAVKPMWLERNFVFALPILGIAKLNVPAMTKLVVIAVLAAANFVHWIKLSTNDTHGAAFEQVVDYLNEEAAQSAKAICVISADPLHTFWSLQRYLNRKNWGNPTQTQPPLTERWINIAQNSPQFVVQTLKLGDYPNFTESEHQIISSGDTDRCDAADIDDVFVVGAKPYADSADVVFENSNFVIHKR